MIEGEARIAFVLSKFRVVLNKGSNDGVGFGDKFLVYGLGPDIIDPETDTSLGALELVKGRGRVVHVQDRTSTIESLEQRNRPGSRKVITRQGVGGFSLLGNSGREEIESDPTTEDIPFADPEIGDYARPI